MTAAPRHPPQPGTVRHWAVKYARHGWRVLPIKPGEKRPPMASWQHAATIDERTIENWFDGLYKSHGVGIATGRESGIFVIDIDTHGADGKATLAALEAKYGKLPPTVTAITGSNGLHLFFRYPTDLPDGWKIGTTKNIGDGIDVRGDGGQVVAHPTVHPNGNPYTWLDWHDPDDLAVAEAPAWLLELVTVQPAAPAPERPTSPPAASTTGQPDSIAEHINTTLRWEDVLQGDGWALERQTGDDTYWRRPGKASGTSAVLHGDGPLVVFTTSVPELQRNDARSASGDTWSYSLFGYIAATRYNGDRSACASAYRTALNAEHAARMTTSTASRAQDVLEGHERPLEAPESDAAASWWLDWQRDVFDREPAEAIVDGVLIPGRWAAIEAAAKTGKSTFTLHIAHNLARGIDPFTGQPRTPIVVAYLDLEMGRVDIHQRLADLDLTAADLDGRLYYRDILDAKGDTLEGGAAIVSAVAEIGAQVVILDGINGAVGGAENDDTTWRALFEHTIQPLKVRGIAVVSSDNLGKDEARGSRGSSVKRDKPDAVLQMKRTDGGVELRCTFRRTADYPESQTFQMHGTDGDEPIRYTTGIGAWPAGTKEVAELLDGLGVPVSAGRNACAKALKEASHKVSFRTLNAAIKWRKLCAHSLDDGPVRADRAQPRTARTGGHLAGETPRTGRAQPDPADPVQNCASLEMHSSQSQPEQDDQDPVDNQDLPDIF